jgi:Flp pilus assembly protein TadG
MSALLALLAAGVRRFAKDKRGASAVIFALASIPIVGLMGFAIDVGNALRVQNALQASTDAAALAGALDITNGNNDAAGTARTYSAVAGGKNTIYGQNVTPVVTLKCFTSTGASCAGPSKSNGLVVQQTTVVNTFFAKIFGINTFTLKAIATAGAAGAKPKPLNVMLVLDTTQSMTQADPNCGSNVTKIACALSGVQTLLGILAPSVDQVGLMVFPGIDPSTVNAATDCSASTKPKVMAYDAPNLSYQLVAPSMDYRSSDNANALNTGSILANAAGGGSGCSGVPAIGGVGTFYADAIWQAQTTLVATDKDGMQNVIVFLSDGDADSSNVMKKSCPANSSVWCTGNETSNQCRNAIKAAQAAASAGTWVFSIAYDASTDASNGSGASCKSDTPRISACSTMQQIASDSGKFFSDSTGKSNACTSSTTSLANLIAIFQTIGQALQQPRLLPNNTA